MDETDLEAFDKFVERHWGNKQDTVQVNATTQTKSRRGRPANTTENI